MSTKTGSRPGGKPRPSGRGSAVAAAQRARRRWQTVWVVLGAVAILGTVAILSFTGGDDGSTKGYSVDQGAFDLPSLTGTDHVRLADHEGRPLVVNFFASWCVYCNQELPGFVQVAKQTRGQVDFIGVQTQDTGDGTTMAARFDLAGAGFALARDVGGTPPSQLWRSFGGQGLPATAFYSSAGELVDFTGGLLSQRELESRLSKNFGITVTAIDASTLQAPVIPLIPQGALELIRKGVDGSPMTVLDARPAQDFARGHLNGAINLDPGTADLDAQLVKYPKDTPILVYDDTGEQSAVLTQRMHDLGFKHLYDLQGGLKAWTRSGLDATTT